MENSQSPSQRGRQLVFPVAVFCMLLSGLAGLIYQVVWTRYLALFTGHTSYAIVAVLVAFMGGLALGNAWLGAKADRMYRPLAVYGWLEVIIGVYALAFPEIYEIASGNYVGMARGVAAGSGMLLGLKFILTLLTWPCPHSDGWHASDLGEDGHPFAGDSGKGWTTLFHEQPRRGFWRGRQNSG